MALTSLAILAAWGGAAITAYLVAVCWRNPVVGLASLQHLPEQLPNVMLGRYIGFLIMAVAFALLGNLAAIAIYVFGLGFMAFHDAQTYKTAGHPYDRHVMAGLAAVVVFLICLLALIFNGAS